MTVSIGSSTPTAMLPAALALSESGVLVNGMSVTDLLSGLEVVGEEPTGQDAADGPEFRGSGVPLWRLEAVRELVAEVLEARAEDPELTSANPSVPRKVFPWGIGIVTSDVLVVGPGKEATASYLRIVGLRARTVDATAALRIAGDLAAARSAVDEVGADVLPDIVDDHISESEVHVGTDTDADSEGGETPSRRASGRSRVPLLATVAVVAVGLLATVLVLRSGGPDTGEENQEGTEGTAAGNGGGVAPTPEATTEPWRGFDRSSGGNPDDEAPTGPERPRPPVTVSIDVPGWTVTDSTDEREIWTSAADKGMRVLTAAVPTPVDNQADLDRAMLDVLDKMAGTGEGQGMTVTARSPVEYREIFPESTTTWGVRLIDGHQVSVGCQYREFSEERLEVCDRVTDTARVL